MDKHEAVAFLFNIAKEIKRSYESPVILLTSIDYADKIYRWMLEIRTALIHNASPLELAQIVSNFHLEWLQAVQDIDNFRKRIKETPREVILNALDYTIKCMNNRYTYFHGFIQQLRATIPAEDRLIMQADLEIMNDMKDTVTSVLHDKKHCFKVNVDQYEYTVKLNYEVDELLNWLDRINDSLAMQFCRVFHMHVPELPGELINTLKQIIDEVADYPISDEPEITDLTESKGMLRTMVRFNASHELEVSKVTEKIQTLEDRINRLKEKKSSAVLALQHKIIYLEERLRSLENLKLSLNALKMEKSREIENEEVLDSAELHIFNHNLPPENRCRLVERLIKLWNNALHHDDAGKSIISILSAVDMKEVFTDDIGEFTVDKYGRKIYSRSDGSYQLNENNELVEVNDDDKHVYFFDDCGRYYLDKKRNRIYKAHANASEYELHPTGQLFKLRETKDGMEYRFDQRGRFYVDDDGHRIYTDPESDDKYELDGFGNLVRIRSRVHFFETCPPEAPNMVVAECRYLQQTVGGALKTCLANVLLHQPADPIAFLADNLVKYRQNIEEDQKRREEEMKMKAERLYYETASVPLQSYVSDEEIPKSYYDYNLDTYQTMMPPEE